MVRRHGPSSLTQEPFHSCQGSISHPDGHPPHPRCFPCCPWTRRRPRGRFKSCRDDLETSSRRGCYAVGEWSIADAAVTPFFARAEVMFKNKIGKYKEGKGKATLSPKRCSRDTNSLAPPVPKTGTYAGRNLKKGRNEISVMDPIYSKGNA